MPLPMAVCPLAVPLCFAARAAQQLDELRRIGVLFVTCEKVPVAAARKMALLEGRPREQETAARPGRTPSRQTRPR